MKLDKYFIFLAALHVLQGDELDSFTSGKYQSLHQTVQKMQSQDKEIYIYKNIETGQTVGIDSSFFVIFKQQECADTLIQNNALLIEKKIRSLHYLLSTPDISQSLQIVEALKEDSCVKKIEFNHYKKVKMR